MTASGAGGSGNTHGRGSLDQQVRHMKNEAEKSKGKPQHEVDEFDVRDDLKSWNLPSDQNEAVK